MRSHRSLPFRQLHVLPVRQKRLLGEIYLQLLYISEIAARRENWITKIEPLGIIGTI